MLSKSYETKWLNKITRKNLNRFYDHYILGQNILLNDLITLQNLTNSTDVQFFLDKTQTKNDNFHIGSDFVGPQTYTQLLEYNSFLFFGFEPRFEASLLNICLARLREDNNSDILNYGSAFENFFSNGHKGSSLKNILVLLEGRDSLLKEYRFIKATKIFYGSEYNSLTRNIQVLMNFLAQKFYTKSSFLSSNLTTLHFLELFGGSSFQKFAAKTKEKSLDSVSYTLSSWFLNSNVSKMPKKHPKNVISDIFELGLYTNTSFEKNVGLVTKMPITSFYENEGLSLSIFGKINKTRKVSSISNSNLYSIQIWISQFYFFMFELTALFWKWWIFDLKRSYSLAELENIDKLEVKKFSHLSINNFDEFGDLKNEDIFINLTDYFCLLNLYNINAQSNIHQYKKMNFDISFNKQKLLNGLSTPQVFNFYTNNLILKHSITMVNLSYVYSSNLLLK